MKEIRSQAQWYLLPSLHNPHWTNRLTPNRPLAQTRQMMYLVRWSPTCLRKSSQPAFLALGDHPAPDAIARLTPPLDVLTEAFPFSTPLIASTSSGKNWSLCRTYRHLNHRRHPTLSQLTAHQTLLVEGAEALKREIYPKHPTLISQPLSHTGANKPRLGGANHQTTSAPPQIRSVTLPLQRKFSIRHS